MGVYHHDVRRCASCIAAVALNKRLVAMYVSSTLECTSGCKRHMHMHEHEHLIMYEHVHVHAEGAVLRPAQA